MAIDKANSERIVPRMPKQSSPAVPFLKVQRSPTKKRRITYNVQAIQSLSGVNVNAAARSNNAVIPSMILGGTAFNRLVNQVKSLEAAAGRTAWFNVGGGGTAGLSYGSNLSQAIGRANTIGDINIALLTSQEQAAGRISAVADELITRGQGGVTSAYDYVRVPNESFKPIGSYGSGLSGVFAPDIDRITSLATQRNPRLANVLPPPLVTPLNVATNWIVNRFQQNQGNSPKVTNLYWGSSGR